MTAIAARQRMKRNKRRMPDDNEFMGYSVFLDQEDRELRTRNQAQVLGNITEFNINAEGVTDRGFQLLTGYFGLIPADDRAIVYVKFIEYIRDVLHLDYKMVVKAAQK